MHLLHLKSGVMDAWESSWEWHIIKFYTISRFEHVALLSLWIKLFIKDNQGGADTTVINHIGLYGSLRDTTNMKDFKRVRALSFPSLKIVR